MKNKILIVAMIAILIIAIVGLFFPTAPVAIVYCKESEAAKVALGGGTRMINGLSTDSTSPSAGQVRTSTLTVTGASTLEKITTGGTVLSTTTATAAFGTTSVSSLGTYGIIVYTPNVSAATTTLSAASYWTTLIPNAGDSMTWTIVNGTTTAAMEVGITSGSGVTIDVDSPISSVATIPTGDSAKLTCTTITAATTIRCQFELFR